MEIVQRTSAILSIKALLEERLNELKPEPKRKRLFLYRSRYANFCRQKVYLTDLRQQQFAISA